MIPDKTMQLINEDKHRRGQEALSHRIKELYLSIFVFSLSFSVGYTITNAVLPIF
jgi:hypothetical protein